MSLIDEYIKELKKDYPSFKDYNITEDNYNTFLMMTQEDSENGDNNPVEGYYHIATPNSNGGYDFNLVPCKDLLRKKNLSYNMDTRFATEGYSNASLDDFRLDTKFRIKALDYAKKFISNYIKDNYMDGLFLHGTYGSGKTYLLSAIGNALALKGIKVSIVFFPELCRELKRTMFKDDSENIINYLKNVDVLLIDDLGAECLTSYIRDDVLGPILNYRWSMHLPFFIASNLNFSGLIEHLSQTKEDSYNGVNDKVRAARIIERIKNSTIDCEFKD